MKKTKITYWIFTSLFAAFMLLSGITNAMNTPDSIDLITNKLGFPLYFSQFIGIAKILGVIGILIPGYPRIKEWAYAGLFFDLIGATFAIFAAGLATMETSFMAIFFILGIGSYIYYHKVRGN